MFSGDEQNWNQNSSIAKIHLCSEAISKPGTKFSLIYWYASVVCILQLPDLDNAGGTQSLPWTTGANANPWEMRVWRIATLVVDGVYLMASQTTKRDPRPTGGWKSESKIIRIQLFLHWRKFPILDFAHFYFILSFRTRLFSLYSENNKKSYFHCTVKITKKVIFTVQWK